MTSPNKAMPLTILYDSIQFHNFPELPLNSQEWLQNISSLCSTKGRPYVLFQSIKFINTWKTQGDSCDLHWKSAHWNGRPRLKMFTPLFDTSSSCFSLPHHSILGQYWNPSWQNAPFPSITHIMAELLIFFSISKISKQDPRAHKKKSRQINEETHYQRLLLSPSVLQSMPPFKISRADSTATKPCSCEHPLSEK